MAADRATRLSAARIERVGEQRFPTGFPELDALLADFVERVSSILADDLVGAYLVGSFALGGGDMASDCDFIVVTENRVDAERCTTRFRPAMVTGRRTSKARTRPGRSSRRSARSAATGSTSTADTAT